MKREAYKRPFDLTLMVLSHLLLSWLFLPLWVLIPLAIWLEDRGPVLYRQERPGKGGKIFIAYKFRTMVPDADRKGPSWTVTKDPRITRLGGFLRRRALDEVPQLLNIWKGDMSLVGPRALPLKEQRWLEQKIPGFEKRLQVQPGLTGLAQVYDPSDDANTKLRYDLEYIQRMNPLLDVKLIVLSVRNTVIGRWDQREGKAKREK